MLLPAHIAGGYLVIKVAERVRHRVAVGASVLFVAVIGAITPDLNFFFYRYIKDHHNNPMYAPLVWLALFLFLHLVIRMWPTILGRYRIYINAFMLGVFSHLFLDWYAGRTTGVMLLYPFSETQYSLFTLHPSAGRVSPLGGLHGYDQWLRFYAHNVFLVVSEVAVMVAGVVVWIVGRRSRGVNRLARTPPEET
jgi:membrane-bound metal-dependent hydrolase YbcI (DUF457 family)